MAQIQLNQVSKVYGGTVRAVNALSLSLAVFVLVWRGTAAQVLVIVVAGLIGWRVLRSTTATEPVSVTALPRPSCSVSTIWPLRSMRKHSVIALPLLTCISPESRSMDLHARWRLASGDGGVSAAFGAA